MKKSNKIKSIFLILAIITTAVAYGGCANSTVSNSSDNIEVTSVDSSSKDSPETKLTESKGEEFSSNIRDDGNMDIIAYDGEANIINVPDSVDGKPVIEIRGYFLRGSDNVLEINVPDTITEISEQAFALCANLEKLTMGNDVQKIGQSLCLGDSKLKQVVLSQSLSEISHYAFQNCTSLEEITIPDSVTTIGFAFSGCTALKEIHMTDSVTFIGVPEDNEECNVFEDSDNLTIYAPAGSYAEQYAKNNNITFVAE